ncbi:MAG: YjbH domain-containing protein [Melioribacteraceae bacterium]|nr:YjbH domain-containing protein [Melioribacteraceae bacterium]
MWEKSHLIKLCNLLFAKQILIFIFLLLFCYSEGYPQNDNNTSSISKVLIENGYENIKIVISGDELLLTFENRVHRFEIYSLMNLIKLIEPFFDNLNNLVLVPLNRKIPISKITIPIKNYHDFKTNSNDKESFVNSIVIEENTDEIMKRFIDVESENSSSLKLDMILKPSTQFEFGIYSQPVRYQLNINSNFRLNLWKGMNLDYEIIIPVHNDFFDREDSIRPGIITLNQTIRLPMSFYLSSTVGFFSHNRFGFDFEALKSFDNGNINLGINFGYTALGYFSGFKMLYNDDFKFTGNVYFNYRVETLDLTLGVMAGKFLYDDKTIRFDISREFGEIEIGFFALRSSEGISNGGVNITIPLWPGNYWNPGIFRVRPAENFGLSYLVNTNTDKLIGSRYNTGNRLNNFNKKINSSFVKNYLNKRFFN